MTLDDDLPPLPEPHAHEWATPVPGGSVRERAAIATLEKAGYTYTPGAELWRPPLGDPRKTIAMLDDNERLRSALILIRDAADAMMAPLGYHGMIIARDDRVQAVMAALAAVDRELGL